MWAFICKYWLEFLFGLIALAISAVAKYYYNLVKTGRATKKEKEKEPIFEEMKKLNQQLSDEIKENNIAFKKDLEACHCALKEEIK